MSLASWAAQWLSRGLVLPTDQGSNPGICTKKLPRPPHIQSTVGLALGCCFPMCVDRPMGYGHCVRMRWGFGSFLGLCEEYLLFFVKMP